MRPPSTLPAFSAQQKAQAHELLATRVAFMMGRKLEEADWTRVYCEAKGIPYTGWSNLNIDVIHNGLGVEQKMVCYRDRPSVREACGTTRMHPAATRSIRVPALDTPALEAMRDILHQYAELIDARREQVRETNPEVEPDLRTGWLIWQESLREFLYFEERMVKPNPRHYYAEWEHRGPGGRRKPSTSLWIFERKTGKKRFSVTTSAGAKIQPYFDVPPPDDPNLCFFQVQGEYLAEGVVRIWLTEATARELRRLVGSLQTDALSAAILKASELQSPEHQGLVTDMQRATPIVVRSEAYAALQSMFPISVSDEHMVQMLVQRLSDG